MSVDEAEKVHAPDLADALDLAKFEPQKLHEGAVLAMAQLVAVTDRRVGDAEPLRDVRLGDGARDPVGIGMSAQRDEQVLAARGGEGLRERTGARLGRRLVRQRQTSGRFRHRGWNCGHV